MQKSLPLRVFIVGVLTLVMTIPLLFTADIIESRATYSRSTIQSVSNEWGGPQIIGGPILMVPVEARVEKTFKVDVYDPETGLLTINPDTKTKQQKIVKKMVTEQRDPIYVMPSKYENSVSTLSDERSRGVFNVPVFRAESQMRFQFDPKDIEATKRRGEILKIKQAKVIVHLSSTRALRGKTEFTLDGQKLDIKPLDTPSDRMDGIMVTVGSKGLSNEMELVLGFNGAKNLSVSPVGRKSTFVLSGDWAHPSFNGAFLPDEKEVGDSGFLASWSIPNLALGLPQASRVSPEFYKNSKEFGVRFYQPNDFYQKAFRISKYGLMFIALTFLTVLLIEKRAERPVHPIQYLMIGLAQSLFVVLMVSFAEQIGFTLAYIASAAATVGLITAYGATALGLGNRVGILGGSLALLYGILFLIVQSQDFALLAGAVLCFCALAGVMFGTRNEQWYSDKKGPSFFERLKSRPDTEEKL